MIKFLIFLTLKHFVVDFLLQTPYQWQNKGKFLHPGGLLHACLHGLATAIILAVFIIPLKTIAVVVLVEMLVHYFTDYLKVNINQWKAWGPNTHPEFWYLLGLDQMIHSLTYLWILYAVSR